jgi:glycosyltransferase involved in cell wall biosynthesis
LVGEGDQREELEARVRENGFGRIHLLGHREDMGDVLRAIDVLVMPSRHEGLPLVLLEAMAAGRPVVATAVGGIPEVVENGWSALLVPPESVETLTRATRATLTDPLRAEALAKTAQQVVARYTAQRMAAQMIAVYRASKAAA